MVRSACGRQPLSRQRQGVGVAVDADQPGLREGLEDRLGVATEAEGGVDVDGARTVEGGREEGDDPVQEDGDVAGARHGS